MKKIPGYALLLIIPIVALFALNYLIRPHPLALPIAFETYIAFLVLAFMIGNHIIKKFIRENVRYIIEISDDFTEHRIWEVPEQTFRKTRLINPIVISFGDIVYADEYDPDKNVLSPTWIHYKVEFLRDRKAMNELLNEYKFLDDKLAVFENITEVQIRREARRRLELLRKLKEKLMEKAMGR